MTQYEKCTINYLVSLNKNLKVLGSKIDKAGAQFTTPAPRAIADDSLVNLPKIKTPEDLERLEDQLLEDNYRDKLVCLYCPLCCYSKIIFEKIVSLSDKFSSLTKRNFETLCLSKILEGSLPY